MAKKKSGPKILVIDFETRPLEVYAWGVNDQNIGVNQIKQDRSILCGAAKWIGDSKMLFCGVGKQRDVNDDKAVVLWAKKLVEAADIIVTQNGKQFDIPLLKGRLAFHSIDPLAVPQHRDTCQMARKMGLPSAKLAYLTATFCPELTKSVHKKFPGQELWTECLKKNPAAWAEMERYNKLDVLGTEAIYKKLVPHSEPTRFDVFTGEPGWVCGGCGGKAWSLNGFNYEATGVYRRFRCKKCGAQSKEKGASNNLLSPAKRARMRGAA